MVVNAVSSPFKEELHHLSQNKELSANAFNLEKAKILLCGKELSYKTTYEWHVFVCPGIDRSGGCILFHCCLSVHQSVCPFVYQSILPLVCLLQVQGSYLVSFINTHLLKLTWNYRGICVSQTHVFCVVTEMCVYKNQQYSQGQSWYDGCDYRCSCDNAESGYYRCQRRWECRWLFLNLFPDDKILDGSKLKQIADNILKCI